MKAIAPQEHPQYLDVLEKVIETREVRAREIATQLDIKPEVVMSIMSSREFIADLREQLVARAEVRYHTTVYPRLLDNIENGKDIYEAIAASKEFREITGQKNAVGGNFDASAIEQMLRGSGVSEIEVTKSAKMKFRGFDREGE